MEQGPLITVVWRVKTLAGVAAIDKKYRLNSLWALIPALEDKTLQAELPGYVDYTPHTP